MNPKRVAVIAYPAHNLGDDLFTSLLVDRYADTQFYFVAPTRESLGAIADRANVSITNDRTFMRTRFDLLLVLGGSMFQEAHAWYRPWLRHLMRFGWARIRGCPTAIVGISFGPSRTSQFLTAHRMLFRIASWISVRDSDSRRALMGIPHLHQFPDLAFAHSLARPVPQTPAEPYIGMSIMDFGPEVSHPDYLSGCAALVESITTAAPVKLFAFQEYGDIDDVAAILKVIGMLTPSSRDRVTIVSYNGRNLPQFLDVFGGCSLVVSTRLHSAILASAMNIPCVAIAYHPKVSDTIESLGLEIPQLHPDHLAGAAAGVRQAVLAAINHTREKSVSRHRAAAMNHLAYLDASLLDCAP